MSLLAERGREADFDAYVTGIFFLGAHAAFALGDGTVRFATMDGEETVAAHDGACLAAAAHPDGRSVLTAGDDGRLVRASHGKPPETIAETGGKWIDRVAASPNGAIAWSSAKSVFVQAGDKLAQMQAPSSVGGLAFAPKGTRLALSHHDGVTLWYPGSEAGEPARLSWKGSHGATSFSPDGRYLVTSMQENALHGWRLSDAKDMRMTGYPSKIRSTAWSAKGRWLATTGAEAAILWPFTGKDGPMGQPAKQLAVRPLVSTAIACHPKQDLFAVGYADGLVLLVKIENGAELLLAEKGGGPVTAMAWDQAGLRLAFGTEEGRVGLLSL